MIGLRCSSENLSIEDADIVSGCEKAMARCSLVSEIIPKAAYRASHIPGSPRAKVITDIPMILRFLSRKAAS